MVKNARKGQKCQNAPYLVFERIEELRLIHEPVDNLLVLLLPDEGAEYPVPDDEPTGIVLVQAVTI